MPLTPLPQCVANYPTQVGRPQVRSPIHDEFKRQPPGHGREGPFRRDGEEPRRAHPRFFAI